MPSSGTPRPDRAGEPDRVAADAVVARGEDVGLAPVGEHALDRARVEARPVGEHDERGLDVVAERGEAAAEARAGAARPVGAADDLAPAAGTTSPSGCAPSTTTTRSTGARPRRSSTGGRSSRCFGEPNRVAAPAASTTAGITRRR